ncbi:MAG: hypothetical protein EXR71_12975, partial [Myxococcales bacterium]|nr:hypothetical protein [Myxococcales bacterium]
MPQLQTTVVSSWKGGVWKTCLSASMAERLAFAGLDILYLVTDDQLDARRAAPVRRPGVQHFGIWMRLNPRAPLA